MDESYESINGVPFIDGLPTVFPRYFDPRRVLPVPSGWLPVNVVQEDNVVPIGIEGDYLVVAVLESCADEILDKVRFICNKEIKVAVVAQDAMAYAVQRYALPK